MCKEIVIAEDQPTLALCEETQEVENTPKVTMLLGGIECFELDGTVYLKLETVARGLGFTTVARSGNECVRWNTVHKYLENLGVATSCNGSDYQECCPDFIPENIFYRLAMKAKNEVAERFQAKVADDIIPTIRRTGQYGGASEKALAQFGQLSESIGSMAESMVQLTEHITRLSDRVDRIEQREQAKLLPGSLSAKNVFYHSLQEDKRRWTDTLNRKLRLVKKYVKRPKNMLLHDIYVTIEKYYAVDLNELKDDYLDATGESCSTLDIVYKDSDFRKITEQMIDQVIPPEERGW